MKHGLRMLGGVFLAVTALIARPTEAHEGEAAKIPGGAALTRAEQQAEAGDLDGAVRSLLDVEPRISIANVGLRPNQDHALRVAARIVARSEKPPFSGFPNDEEQFKWAYLQVRKLKDADPTPSLLTDFGEIGSRIRSERLLAQKTLEQLDHEGTMGSSFGYAALARLHDEAGRDSARFVGAPLRALEAASRQVALVRCSKIAKNASHCEKGWLAAAAQK